MMAETARAPTKVEALFAFGVEGREGEGLVPNAKLVRTGSYNALRLFVISGVLLVHDLSTYPRKADRGMNMAIFGLVVLGKLGGASL